MIYAPDPWGNLARQIFIQAAYDVSDGDLDALLFLVLETVSPMWLDLAELNSRSIRRWTDRAVLAWLTGKRIDMPPRSRFSRN